MARLGINSCTREMVINLRSAKWPSKLPHYRSHPFGVVMAPELKEWTMIN